MASEPITPISEMALRIGCRCTTTFTPQITAIPANTKNNCSSIGLAHLPNNATRKAVANRLITATGNKNFQANLINWS